MFQTFGIVHFYNSAKMLSSSPKILAWFLLALPAFAQDECTATGVDFTDGGTYSVDSSSTSKFTFATIFSGGYPWTVLLLAHNAVSKLLTMLTPICRMRWHRQSNPPCARRRRRLYMLVIGYE